jgi:signal recognition particle receptor subunit beta
MCVDPDLRDFFLLIMANKQDLPNAVSPAEMAETLGNWLLLLFVLCFFVVCVNSICFRMLSTKGLYLTLKSILNRFL